MSDDLLEKVQTCFFKFKDLIDRQSRLRAENMNSEASKLEKQIRQAQNKLMISLRELGAVLKEKT